MQYPRTFICDADRTLLETWGIKGATPLAIISWDLMERIARDLPQALPANGREGDWIDAGNPIVRNRQFHIVIPDQLWDHFGDWRTDLFVAQCDSDWDEDERHAHLRRIRLVAPVERWSEAGLWKFCWMQASEALLMVRVSHDDGKPHDRPDDRLLHALDTAFRFHHGLATFEELDQARRGALELRAKIGEPNPNPFAGSEKDKNALRVGDVADAAALLCTPDAEDEPPGTKARQACNAAFRVHHHHGAPQISTKVLGRRREADLLSYLDVGEPWERTLIEKGRSPDGGFRVVRYAVHVQTGQIVDFTNPEDDLDDG